MLGKTAGPSCSHAAQKRALSQSHTLDAVQHMHLEAAHMGSLPASPHALALHSRTARRGGAAAHKGIGLRGATDAPGAHLVQPRVLPPREHLVAALVAAGAVPLRARTPAAPLSQRSEQHLRCAYAAPPAWYGTCSCARSDASTRAMGAAALSWLSA